MRTRAWISMLLLTAMPLLSSCELTNERGRTAVEISAVNNGGVYVAAMLDLNNTADDPLDDFVPAGHVPVTVKNRPGDAFITVTENSPFGHFHITEVQVTWSGTPTTPPAALAALQAFNYRGGFDIIVNVNTERTFNVVVASFEMKASPYFQDLLNGANPPFMAVADIQLTGHDSGSEQDVTLSGSVLVEFIDRIISSDE